MTARHEAGFAGIISCALLLGACATRGGETSSRTVFSGTVRDNLGQPVAGAEVTVAGGSTRTEPDGRFRVAAQRRRPWGMTVRHPDFAHYSRLVDGPFADGRFSLTRASRTRADPNRRIVLRDERRPEDCRSGAPGGAEEVPCGSGIAVDIPAGALVDEAGNRQIGPVDVRLATFEIGTESMPGPPIVVASDSDDRAVGRMTPYGAGMVEIHDAATGRRLNLASGARARISIPVHPAAARRSGAAAPPATIPLLRFNERMQRWVRIGTMSLANGAYSADVDHLSSFNADTVAPTWGCFRIRIYGTVPTRVVAPNNPVRIEVRSFPTGVATGTPIETLNFVTTETGVNTGGTTVHVLYAVTPFDFYFIRVFDVNPANPVQLNDTVNFTNVMQAVGQWPQLPVIPVDPQATCIHFSLYWDANWGRPTNPGWGTLEAIAGAITFQRAVDLVGATDGRDRIERIPAGASLSAIGLLRDRRWIAVQSQSGAVGLVPRDGADLSQIERPPPRPRRPDGEPRTLPEGGIP